MRARKPVGRASYLLTGVVTDSRPVPQPVTRDTPKDDAYYIAQAKAARPAILLYLNGTGPRPKDFWLWHDASQDRKTLRRLHAKGLARDDPRSLDALIEALYAGDSLSRQEGRDLAAHFRLMEDLMYPSLEQRASQLSAQARALGAYKNWRQVAEITGQKEGRDNIKFRMKDWQKIAIARAEQIPQTAQPKPKNSAQLAMAICGFNGKPWNPKAQWHWNSADDPRTIPVNDPQPHKYDRSKYDRCKRWVTADTLCRFLRDHHLPA